MPKEKSLIKKDIREMAQQAITAGMIFQYQAVTVDAIAADTGVSIKDAQRILDEMRVQMHRCVAMFGIDPNSFDTLLDATDTPAE